MLVIAFMLLASQVYIGYLYVLFLFVPLLDPLWRFPGLNKLHKFDRYSLAICTVLILIVLANDPARIKYFLLMLLFTALPEEWFFRAYLLKRLGRGVYANIIVSVAFSILHAISQNYIMALMVFFPSMLYGWIYQRTGNLITVIILHASSNLIFIVYFREILSSAVLLWQ